jgi:hypothetical protein
MVKLVHITHEVMLLCVLVPHLCYCCRVSYIACSNVLYACACSGFTYNATTFDQCVRACNSTLLMMQKFVQCVLKACVCCRCKIRCKISYILTSFVTYSGICHLAERDGIDQVGSPRAHQIEPNIMSWILQRIVYLEHVKIKRVPASSARLQTVQPVGEREIQGRTKGCNQESMASLIMLVLVAVEPLTDQNYSYASNANQILIPNVLDA